MELTKYIALAALVSMADGHGAMVSPRSRNSIDYTLGIPFKKTSSPCANVTGAPCNNGQAAFWYSQGCFIGCPTCDHISGRRQTDLCKLGAKPTINNPKFRSLNRDQEAQSKFDIYQHNPWRWPGNAPVANPCGLAGGTPWGWDVSEEGVYYNTTYAHHGMAGTDLPELPTGVVWTLGLEAEVTWAVKYNHGGGYQYRLCPAEEELTEACFQRHPLEFVRNKQALVFANGTRFPINGTFIDQGTVPEGSTWSMIPLPPDGQGPRCGCR
eukprot:m.395630 g.395630  ORF g.395630 m.395630 type:complete len:268 (-) comp21104_c0_seq1:75-878(-)